MLWLVKVWPTEKQKCLNQLESANERALLWLSDQWEAGATRSGWPRGGWVRDIRDTESVISGPGATRITLTTEADKCSLDCNTGDVVGAGGIWGNTQQSLSYHQQMRPRQSYRSALQTPKDGNDHSRWAWMFWVKHIRSDVCLLWLETHDDVSECRDNLQQLNIYNTLPRSHQASEFREGYHNNNAANDLMEADTLITFIILEANCSWSKAVLCSNK